MYTVRSRSGRRYLYIHNLNPPPMHGYNESMLVSESQSQIIDQETRSCSKRREASNRCDCAAGFTPLTRRKCPHLSRLAYLPVFCMYQHPMTIMKVRWIDRRAMLMVLQYLLVPKSAQGSCWETGPMRRRTTRMSCNSTRTHELQFFLSMFFGRFTYVRVKIFQC